VKVTVGCRLRENKSIVKVFCQIIICMAQVEVGNGLMSFVLRFLYQLSIIVRCW